MIKNVFRKGLVIGIIILFFGASIVPAIMSGERETLDTSDFVATESSYDCDWIVDDEGDGDFETIQGAIDNESVQDGDTICVYSGTYDELVNIPRELKILGNSSEYGEGNDTGPPLTGGFSVFDCSNVTLSNFRLYAVSPSSISLDNAHNCVIDNCYTNVLSMNSSTLNIVNNSYFHSSVAPFGIYLYHSDDNTIINNDCYAISLFDPCNGILVEKSDFNKIINNTCEAGPFPFPGLDIAMELVSSNHNRIKGNKCWNSEIGVYVDSSSGENFFYLNHFENNTKYNAYDGSEKNQWHSPVEIWYPPGETDPKYYNFTGNWWDDYIGGDSGNGRGIVPYDKIRPLYLENKDEYPIGKFYQDDDPWDPEVTIHYPIIGYYYLWGKKLHEKPKQWLKELQGIVCIGGFKIFSLEAEVTDEGSGVHEVIVYIDKDPKNKKILTHEGATNMYKGRINIVQFALFNNLVVEAKDKCGNIGKDSILLIFYFNILP